MKTNIFIKAAFKYIKWHYMHVKYLLDKVLINTDGQLFCFLFNAKSYLLRRSIRFSVDVSTQKYTAISDNVTQKFFHKQQANLVYRLGLKHRIEYLSDVYFLDKIEFQDGDIVVDCGANVGDLFLCLNELEVAIEYVGFEPSPLEYQCLVENVDNQTAKNVGLWNRDGELQFYLSSQCADSSFIEPPEYDEVIKVSTVRLDDVLDCDIKLLKLEAEGAEPEVLIGCEKLLEKIEYISADLGFERGLEQSSTLPDVTNFLLSNGFELVDLSHNRIVALFHNTSFK